MSEQTARLDAGDPEHDAVATLSELERTVLIKLVQGLSVEDIAGQTGYSEHLIALVQRGICDKTKANNLAHAVSILHRSGAIDL